MPKIIEHPAEPYTLDEYEFEKTTLPALTDKNAEFIEAILKLDSNYAKEFAYTEPDKDFDPEEKKQNKYCGSIQYWFEEMQKDGADFSKCVLGAIISIDRSNSTHLNAATNGRVEMRTGVSSPRRKRPSPRR